MMRGLKTLVFAAGLAFAVGCGGTELEPEIDNSELGTKESALGYCYSGQTNPCGPGATACCKLKTNPAGPTYCAIVDDVCGGTWCSAGQTCFNLNGGSYCDWENRFSECVPLSPTPLP